MVNDLERQQFLAALAATLAIAAGRKMPIPPDRIELTDNQTHIDRLEDQLGVVDLGTQMWDESDKPVIEGIPQAVCLRFLIYHLLEQGAIVMSEMIELIEAGHPSGIQSHAYEFLDAWGIVHDLNATGGINTMYRAVDS